MPGDPSNNGGTPPRPDSFEMRLEPVDASELNLDEIPTVEAVQPITPPETLGPEAGLGQAALWCAFFLFTIFDLFAGFVLSAAFSISRAVVFLGAAIYSATRPGFRFGKALLWCLLFLLVTQGFPAILMSIALVIAVVDGAKIPIDSPDWMTSAEAQPLLAATMVAGQLATIAFSLLILRWIVGREWRRRIALRLPSLEHVILVLVAMPALLIVANAIEMIVVRHVPSLTQLLGLKVGVNEIVGGTKTWPWMAAVAIIGIGPAIGEELWCRGFLGCKLAARYGTWGSVLLSSFFFGVIHIEPPQAIMAMLMGVVLHLSYLATRSILVPMLIHCLNNSLVVLNISDTGRVPLLETLETAYNYRPVVSVLASLFVLATIGYALYRSRARVVAQGGMPAPQSLHAHVELPRTSSAYSVAPDSLPVVEIGILIVAVGFFAAIWFGL